MDCYPGRNQPSLCQNSGTEDVSFTSHPVRAGSSLVTQSSTDLVSSQSASSHDDVTLRTLTDTGEPSERFESTPQMVSHRSQTPLEVDDTREKADVARTDGNLSLPAADHPVIKVYDEIVHWKKKFFNVPNNAVGKAFVMELALQLQNFANLG